MRKIIIIGLTPQGLSLLRTLSRYGVEVIAFYQNIKNVGVYSKYGQKKHFVSVADLKGQITALVNILGYKPLCYITSGELLALILREYKELYQQCEVSSGPYEVVELLAHKDRMYKLAIAKGFTVAKYITLDKYKEGDFSYPLFMKRNYEIPLFFKAVKIKNEEMMASYTNRIPVEEKRHVIVQEFISIPKQDLVSITGQAFYCKGVAKGHFVGIQVRKLKKGLTACVQEISDESISKHIIEQMDDFMVDMNYDGFAEFEYMYDKKKNVLHFLEINTRTCGTQSAFDQKFKNLAQVVVRPNKDMELVSVEKPVHWMNILRDVRSRIENRDFRHLGDIFRCNYDIFDCHDIKPFFKQLF